MKTVSPNRNVAAIGVATLLSAAAGPTNAAGDWEFALSPLFLWGVSLDGDASIEGRAAPLDLDFQDDIFENMDAVFTLHFEARNGNWTIFTEYQFVDLDPDVEAEAGPVAVAADVDFEEQVFELGAAWAFSANDRTRWELLGGGR